MNPWWYVVRVFSNCLKIILDDTDSPTSSSKPSQTNIDSENQNQDNNQKRLGICPFCSRTGKWDGNRCEYCGYDMILRQINFEQYFRNSVLYAPKQLFENKELIPDKPGVYGWYFCHLFDKLFVDDASKADFTNKAIKMDVPQISNENYSLKYLLMYIGIAGRTKGRTLRDRIYDEHLKQNTVGSTVRHSLAALLYDNISLDPRDQLCSKEEKDKLNAWIFDNARVAWLIYDDPEPIETEFIRLHGHILPLNVDKKKY